jgi:putative membrane protein
MKNAILVGTLVAAMAAAPAFASGRKGKRTAGKPMSDQTFVMDVAKGGTAEVELGKLAQDKAASPEVKNFAKRMVDDHTKANDELQTLAKNKNISLPTDLDAKDKALRDRLSKLSGAAFDRAYMNAMVSDHRKVVAEFKRESTAGKDPEVKAFASKTLPTIEEHLKLAQDTTRAVGTTGTKASKRPYGK